MLTPVEDVTRAFADAVVEAFASRPGPRFALVLSGGPTARACYEVLAETGGVDWSLVDVYVGDERMVPPDDEDANQRLIREALLDRVGGVGSFRPMRTELPVAECVAAYQRVIGRSRHGARDRPDPSRHGARRAHGVAVPGFGRARGGTGRAGGGDTRIPTGSTPTRG